jgi:hypothetical protein
MSILAPLTYAPTFDTSESYRVDAIVLAVILLVAEVDVVP